MKEIMTVEEIAKYLRVTERTIYRLLRRGSIPATKVGRQWRFNRAYIDEWLRWDAVREQPGILVIDDEDAIRALFEETLRKRGYRVATAKNGSEGLELVNQQDFALVFIDLKMPGIDGAVLFGHIKTINPNLPVVIITGYPNSDVMARALAHGPFGIIKKPFNDLDIIMAVNTFLQTGKEKEERKHEPVSKL